MPEIIEWWVQEGLEKGREDGLQQGLRQNALDNARKMLERGCDWPFITDVTGMRPEDLGG
jgi:predicted transposase YdaD